MLKHRNEGEKRGGETLATLSASVPGSPIIQQDRPSSEPSTIKDSS